MTSGILRSSYSIPWAPRAGSSSTASSPSSSCVPAHSTPERRESPLVEASPAPLVLSPKAEPAKERRSAPLDCDSEGPTIPNPAKMSQHPGSPLTQRPGLGKNLGGRAEACSKDSGVDDPSNSASRLQPGAEEVHSGNNVDDDLPLASTVIPPAAMHGHPEAQEREESWGETFQIKWLCTERIPFHRTRHLRNVWNRGREIKVSRDGTELEPGVGQQLVGEWLTLAREVADDDRRTACLAGRRVAKFGPSVEPKGAKEEPS